MYLPSTNTTEVNQLLYQLFCARRGEVESSQLPPCKDCLFMHVIRADYQAAIWRKCLQSQPSVPDPKDCGWTTDQDGKMFTYNSHSVEVWLTCTAPEAVLQPDCLHGLRTTLRYVLVHPLSFFQLTRV